MSEAPASTRWIVRRLAAYARPYRWRTALAFATFVATGVTVLCIGAAIRALIDRGVHRGAADLNQVVFSLLALVGVYAAAAAARSYLSSSIAERMANDVLVAVFDRSLAHVPAFFEGRGGANRIWSELAVDRTAVQAMMGALLTTSRNVLIVVGGLAAMLTTSLKLSLATIAVTLVTTVVLRLAGRRIRRLSDAAQGQAARSSAYGLEALGTLGAIKVFGREDEARGRFHALTQAALGANLKLYGAQARVSGAAVLMIFGSAVLLAWISGREVVAGRMTEGMASAFLFYALVVAGAASGLTDAFTQAQRGLGAAGRILALVDRAPEIVAPAEPRALPAPFRGEIHFDGVDFAYPSRPGQPVLQAFDWRAEAGKVLALVGPSGAGKSTLFQLLVRFYDPDRGSVRVDGVDIRSFDPAAWRARIGLVPQDPVLLDGDIYDNIRYGRPQASAAEVEAAARAAHVLEFAERLPDGLRTAVGGRGVQLSGGQRQRVAIARVMLRDPPILLFDEATNALDAESEHRVQTALQALAQGRTTLVIAHRLATVRRADCILVIKAGRVAAHGVHDDLLRDSPDYGRWFRLQHLAALAPDDPAARLAEPI